MNTNFKLAVTVTCATTIVGVAALTYIKSARIERAKRREIEKNLQLDLAAIHRAALRVDEKIQRGDFAGQLYRLPSDFNDEVEFQKIAIREEI